MNMKARAEATKRQGRLDELAVIRVACTELDRLTLNYESRFGSVQSKAALLITGAAIVAGLAADKAPSAVLAMVVPALAAMVLGILALWPSTQQALNGNGVRKLLLPSTPPMPSERIALLTVFDYRRHALNGAEDRLRKMGTLLRAGFVALAVSVLPLIVEAMFELACKLSK